MIKPRKGSKFKGKDGRTWKIVKVEKSISKCYTLEPLDNKGGEITTPIWFLEYDMEKVK